MSITNPKQLLITGGSSGIGLEGCRILAKAGHQLSLLCRSVERCRELEQKLLAADAQPSQLRMHVVDLGDLSSVERFCQTALEDQQPLDALVLNAGLQLAGIQQARTSAQGMELTVAVNHLAHQWLAMRLLPLLLRSKEPRVVITASDVHNPTTGGGRVGKPAGLGNLAGLKQGSGVAMLDGDGRFDADKAYKDSKLCNVLMGRELARQLQASGHRLPVIAWSPGLVIPKQTGGFFRTSRQVNPIGMAVFALLARDVIRLTERVERAGELLASLVTEERFERPGFQYWSNHLLRPGRHQFEEQATSVEAADMDQAARLWTLSAQRLSELVAHS